MMKRELRAVSSTVVTLPANVADEPGPAVGDVSFEATLADGKVVKVTALLVDAITEVPVGFDQRYESLTPTADVIAYNGHAGLGQNVRALAQKGRWVAGKYQMFFMNGCDTFAYVDGSLAQTRAKLNPDDPTGTKYMGVRDQRDAVVLQLDADGVDRADEGAPLVRQADDLRPDVREHRSQRGRARDR